MVNLVCEHCSENCALPVVCFMYEYDISEADSAVVVR